MLMHKKDLRINVGTFANKMCKTGERNKQNIRKISNGLRISPVSS